MSHRVIVQPGAKLQLYNDALWWAEHRDLDQALRWLEGFEAALDTLSNNPQRHAKIHENDLFDWPRTYHQLLYGLGNRPTHRAVFCFDEATVHVAAIRHLHQGDLTPEDVS